MILYQLRCSGDHAFEAWFKDSAAYDEQAASGAVVCPDCGNTTVRKAPMAPRIAKGRGEKAADSAGGAGPSRTDARARSPEMREALGELRRQVEENCDYVGGAFAEEARKIHYGEADERNIYGEATDDEAQELTEEGIKVGKIPWLPRTDS